MTARAFIAAALSVAVLSGCPDDPLRNVVPDILVPERTIDFGTLPVLNTGVYELEVGNRGQAALVFGAIEVVGPDAQMFWVEETPEQVPFGGQTVLSVFFRPEEEDLYAATLRIPSNDEDEPVVEVALAGEGRTVAAIEVEPVDIHFGIVGEGQTAVESFVIRSVGTAPLIVEDVSFTAETPAEFIEVGSWGSGTLDVGEEIPLSVGFQPAAGQVDLTGGIVITSTDPRNRTVEVSLASDINRAPVPACSDEEILAAPGDVVSFDGLASVDPDGHDPITYRWRVDSRPVDSNTDIADAQSPTASLQLDVAGRWEVTLCVTDALGVESTECCRVRIRAVPAEKLYIELIWDHPQTDLDLHFLAPGAAVGSPGDCYWGNPAPDFGTLGVVEDDPFLNRDDLAGFGPEVVSYKDPPPGTYRVVVDYAKDNGAANPVTEGTVRIYQFGVIVAEISRTLGQDRTLWNVAAIEWPSGEVSTVDSVSSY